MEEQTTENLLAHDEAACFKDLIGSQALSDLREDQSTLGRTRLDFLNSWRSIVTAITFFFFLFKETDCFRTNYSGKAVSAVDDYPKKKKKKSRWSLF